MPIIPKSICKFKMNKQIIRLVIAVIWLIVTVVGLVMLFA